MSFWTELSNTPFKVDWIDAGGIRTRFLEAGSGQKTILFLHGVAGHLDTFLRNIAAHAKDYRVLAMDMIGHGYSAKPDHDYELTHYVSHVISFLDAMGVDRVNLCGTSLGGWTSARIAASFPDRVEKLALVSSAGLTATPSVMNTIKTLSTNAALSSTKEAVRKRLEWVIKDPAKVDDEILETRWRIYNQPDYQKGVAHVMCLQEPEIRKRNLLTEQELGRIKAPTIVIWTQDDPTADVETGRRYANAIPGSKFILFTESSHIPQFEESEKFNQVMLEFWRS